MTVTVHLPTTDVSEFVPRHNGPDAADQAAMLAEIGYASRDELVDAAVPTAIRTDRPLALPAPATERQAADELAALAARNTVLTPMIGLGYRGTNASSRPTATAT